MVVWLSVPTSVSGIGDGPCRPSCSHRGLGEILEVDLMADAGARRHHAEVVERLLAPAQEA